MKNLRAWHSDEALIRFRSFVSIDESGCLHWDGWRNKLGYGVFHFKGMRLFACHYTYQLSKGFVPKGLELDHLCRNPSCVNPFHLEAVTHQENIKRGVRFWQKCPHGDKFRQKSNRTCTVCANKLRRENRAKKTA